MSRKTRSGSEFFSKINVLEIFTSHLRTLKNYKQSSYSRADITVFFVFPLIFSSAVVFSGFKLDKDLVGVLINVFAILAGFLFNLLVLVYEVTSRAVRVGNTVQQNNLSLDKLEEISSNVSFEVSLAIINVLLLAASSAFLEGVPNVVFSLIIFYLVTLFTLTLFMVVKRVHKLLLEEIQYQRKSLTSKS